MRLTPRGYSIGLASQERYDRMLSKRELRDNLIELARKTKVRADVINPLLIESGSTALSEGTRLYDLILRPQLSLESLIPFVPALRKFVSSIPVDLRDEVVEAAQILIKYQGYIDRERMIADKISRLESIKIKGKFDYNSITAISTEARQKLKRIDPETIAQASRIPGVSPNDINVLLLLCGR